MSAVDITISTGSCESRNDQISESETVLGPRRAEEHGRLVICSAKVSDYSTRRRLWAQFRASLFSRLTLRSLAIESGRCKQAMGVNLHPVPP